jgi:hypothetical protein
MNPALTFSPRSGHDLGEEAMLLLIVFFGVVLTALATTAVAIRVARG